MSQELQTNRYDQIMRRVGGLIGPGSKVGEVLGELFPVIDVERIPGELLVLGGTRLCWGGGTITGAAGEAGKMQLFNPPESGTLITVSRVDISSSNTTNIRWGLESIALTTGIATQLFRDGRLGLIERPTGEIRQLSAVALAPGTNQIRLLANSVLSLRDENSVAVLTPGVGLTIGPNTVAIPLFATFSWRERAVEQSEVNF